MMTKNHFATLGVKIGAGEDEIKKAYRSLAKQWHPDKNPNPGAEEKFKEIASAYEYLQSKDRREILARDLGTKNNAPAASSQSKTFSGTNASSSKPSYNWDYKGTEKTPPPKASTSSSQAGPSQSTGKSNAGSKSQKKKTPHWSDSFRKKNKGRAGQKETSGGAEWKPWDSDWEEEREHVPPPRYSDAFSSFRAFVDHLNSEFGDGPIFFGADDLSDGIFGEAGPFSSSRRQRGSMPRTDPRNVASEHGYSGGLDDDLLFNARPSHKGEAKTVRCPVCNRMIAPSKLAKHEQHCGKFDAPSDSDDDIPDYEGRTYFSEDEDEEVLRYFGRKQSKDWRSTHQDVLHKIRQDRRAYQAELNRQGLQEHECEWCGRTFTLLALKRHLPICKEHVLRYGRPMNPAFSTGPPPDSKFARGRRYSENVPRPNAAGFSQQGRGGVGEHDSDNFSTDDGYSQPSPSPSPPNSRPTASHFSQYPGNERPTGRPNPSQGAAKKQPSTDTGKPAAGKADSSRNSFNRNIPSGLQGRTFNGTGFKVGANVQANRQAQKKGSHK